MYKALGDLKVRHSNRFLTGLGENLDLCKVTEDLEDSTGGDRVVGTAEPANQWNQCQECLSIMSFAYLFKSLSVRKNEEDNNYMVTTSI